MISAHFEAFAGAQAGQSHRSQYQGAERPSDEAQSQCISGESECEQFGGGLGLVRRDGSKSGFGPAGPGRPVPPITSWPFKSRAAGPEDAALGAARA